MEKRTYRIPIYGAKLCVIVAEDLHDVIDKYNLNADSSMDAFIFRIDNTIYCVFENGFRDHGVIAHECLHVVNRIMGEISHKTDPYNDEPEAYLLTWVVNTVYRALDKMSKPSDTEGSMRLACDGYATAMP